MLVSPQGIVTVHLARTHLRPTKAFSSTRRFMRRVVQPLEEDTYPPQGQMFPFLKPFQYLNRKEDHTENSGQANIHDKEPALDSLAIREC